MPVPTAQQKIRFGAFELDRQTAELYKHGTKLKLQGQPIAVLALFLERPGELVTREEIRKHLWPEDTFVDFEHSLNTHIKKLRQVLDDAAETPRYIETLPRRGYRFIAQVDTVPNGNAVVEEPEPSRTPAQKVRSWKYAAAAALIVAIVAGALYWIYRPRIPVVTGIHQLTHTGRRKAAWNYHRPLTDGTRVYFDEFKTELSQVAQVSTKGGDVSYFELPPIQNAYLSDLSSDGSELLIEDWSGAPAEAFWIFPLPNGPAQKVPSGFWYMQFLPGGKQLLGIKNRQMFAVDRDSEQTRPLMSLPDSFGTDVIESFAISPDGKRVRFATRDNKMWESNLDGSRMRPFLPHDTELMCCGNWSADGDLFVFSSRGREGDNLWAVTERGLPFYRVVSPPVQLTNGPMPFRYSTVSRDGKQILALGETTRGELSVYDAQSREFRPYLNGISAGFVEFSPNGQWVTYVAYPEATLWKSRVDGTERLQLTTPSLGVILNPRWSPDGKSIVFSSWRSVEIDNRIYLVSAEGGAPLLLLSGDFSPNDPTWSPDGKSIAYGGSAGVGEDMRFTEIRILDLETRKSTSVPGSKGFFSPRWSPDGHFIAAQSGDSRKLFLYHAESGRWIELTSPAMRRTDYFGWPAWSSDSRYLYADKSQFVGGQIYRFRVPDGNPELVVDNVSSDAVCPVFRWTGCFGLTPDNRIMVLRDRGFDELYALDLEYR